MDTTTAPPLPLKEAAARLGVNPVTLKRRAKAGDLAALRTGAGHWLFEVDALDAFKAKHLTPRPFHPVAD